MRVEGALLLLLSLRGLVRAFLPVHWTVWWSHVSVDVDFSLDSSGLVPLCPSLPLPSSVRSHRCTGVETSWGPTPPRPWTGVNPEPRTERGPTPGSHPRTKGQLERGNRGGCRVRIERIRTYADEDRGTERPRSPREKVGGPTCVVACDQHKDHEPAPKAHNKGTTAHLPHASLWSPPSDRT
eukprot:scaffold1852_cov318-Pavlova_lutheri.AAC.1